MRCKISGKRAFALIELLVVIAIIALLPAILMPSLRRIRSQAKGVTCRNNLKQIGIAFTPYTDNNEGKCPHNGGIWIVKFLPYIDDQGDEDGSWHRSSEKSKDLVAGVSSMFETTTSADGADGDRRVVKACHRDGCNVAFMDSGSDWIQAEKMTKHMRQPE